MRRRKVHLARHVAPDGQVSAWCYASPRPIPMHTATWTMQLRFVTCSRCRAAFKVATHAPASGRDKP